MSLPKSEPMIPTLVPKPFHRDGWAYEEKVDGYRMIAYKAGLRVQLLSRHGVDHLRDGELAVFDQQLRSRFDWLRHRQPVEIATTESGHWRRTL